MTAKTATPDDASHDLCVRSGRNVDIAAELGPSFSDLLLKLAMIAGARSVATRLSLVSKLSIRFFFRITETRSSGTTRRTHLMPFLVVTYPIHATRICLCTPILHPSGVLQGAEMLVLQGSCGFVVTEREGFEPSVPRGGQRQAARNQIFRKTTGARELEIVVFGD
jgi:hypothetical protein